MRQTYRSFAFYKNVLMQEIVAIKLFVFKEIKMLQIKSRTRIQIYTHISFHEALSTCISEIYTIQDAQANEPHATCSVTETSVNNLC